MGKKDDRQRREQFYAVERERAERDRAARAAIKAERLARRDEKNASRAGHQPPPSPDPADSSFMDGAAHPPAVKSERPEQVHDDGLALSSGARVGSPYPTRR